MVWQRRYTVLVALFLAYALCYLDRMVMASVIPFISIDLHLSPLVMGEILSSFFLGYTLMQIPGGLLADRFGPRIVLTWSIVWWSLMTTFTGIVPGVTTMIVVRMLFGLGEGPFAPAASKAIALWFPSKEVARANGVQLASSALGATAAPLVVTALVAHWGWRSIFYALFAPGLVVASLVWTQVRGPPARERTDPRCDASMGSLEVREAVSIGDGLLRCMKTPVVLWCAGCLFVSNMAAWGLMNWLPTYLLQARGFGVEKMGSFVALTNLSGAVGYPVGGYICDKYFSRNLKIPIIIGLAFSAIFIYGAARAPTGGNAVACLAAVFLLGNISGSAIFTLPILSVPRRIVGAAFGIVNSAGQLAGVLSPLLVGFVLNATHSNYEVMLECLVALTLIGIVPALFIRQPVDFELRPSQEIR